jgi:hypothetical protein
MVLGRGHWFRSDSLRQPMEHPTPCLPSRGWEHLRRRAGRSRLDETRQTALDALSPNTECAVPRRPPHRLPVRGLPRSPQSRTEQRVSRQTTAAQNRRYVLSVNTTAYVPTCAS